MEKLKAKTKGCSNLEERLSSLWRPQAQTEEQKEYKRQEAKWKLQDKKRKEKQSDA